MTTASAASAGPAPKRLRADAQRSRDRILAVAHGIISRDGEHASLDEIARAAGVGSATLYRHFPDRWALIDTLFRERVDELCAQADAASTSADPGDSLRAWTRLLARDSIRNRGLAAAMLLGGDQGMSRIRSCHAQVMMAGHRLTDAAIAAGQIRADIRFDDLAVLITGIVVALDSAAVPDDADRLMGLALEGFDPR